MVVAALELRRGSTPASPCPAPRSVPPPSRSHQPPFRQLLRLPRRCPAVRPRCLAWHRTQHHPVMSGLAPLRCSRLPRFAWHDMCMAHACPVHGTSKAWAWLVHHIDSMCMALAQRVHGARIARACHMHSMCMAHAKHVHGKGIACAWHLHHMHNMCMAHALRA